MSNYYEQLGKKIAIERKDKKMSQSELAKHLGKKSSTYIALIESGKRKISVEQLEKIARILDTPLKTLLGKDLSNVEPEEGLKMVLATDPDLNNSQRRKILKFYRFLKHDQDV